MAANAFTLFGELKVDSASFRAAMNYADNRAKASEKLHSQLEQQKARAATQTSLTQQRLAAQAANTQTRSAAAVERATIQSETTKQRIAAQSAQAQARLNLAAETAATRSELLKQRLAQQTATQQQRLAQQSSQFQQRMATQASVRFEREQQRMQAAATRAANATKFQWSRVQAVFGGTLLAGGVAGMTIAMKDLGIESVKMFGTLDKLTRFTATLDKNFQSPEALKKFQEDIKKLSTEIPHSAESIAKASFNIKSAFQNLTEPQLIEYLREFGNAATASNTDIASHAFNMAALAKQYKIGANDLRAFSALMTSAFGQALATDEKVSAGFNRILSAAQSTKQPLNDMAAAMSTLQSVSSDAEGNTTLLLNTYAKLTDPKYIEGMKEMGVSVFDAAGNFKTLNQLINEMAKELEGMSDKEANEALSWAKDLQAREGIKILIRQVADYNKQLKDGADEEAFKAKNELMLNSVEARWEKFSNKINNIKMSLGAIVVDVGTGDTKTLAKDADSAGLLFAYHFGKSVREGVLKEKMSMSDAVLSALNPIAGIARLIGAQVGQGFIDGLRSKFESIRATMGELGSVAETAARSRLDTRSPSKVFMKIGQDVAQGFINGITAMRASVHAAMADLVDVRNIKGLTKKDAPGVELITRLIEEYNELNPLTAKQAMLADIEAGKYGKVNKELEAMAIKLRDRIDLMKQIQERNEKFLEFRDALSGSGIEFPDFSMFTAEGEGTGISEAFDAEVEKMEKAWDELIIKMGQPPPIDTWANFWGGMQYHLQRFKESLPSMKEALGVNLINSIESVGNVFANAVSQWDGTAKGFFQSLAQGFRSMIQQIISELIRLAVMKAILNIVGSLGGSLGGAAGGAGSSAGGAVSGAISGLASGGMVEGRGTGTSDSILARLSKGEFVMNAEAVKKWGSGFMHQLNSGFTPAFAGGGMVGGASYSNTWSPSIVVNVSGGGDPNKVRQSAKQGVNEAMRMFEREKMRHK
jgi:TP901 family phage tail tape measure protein